MNATSKPQRSPAPFCARRRLRAAPVITALLLTTAARGESLTYELTPQPDKGKLKVEVTYVTGRDAQSALGVSRQWGTLLDVPGVIKSMEWRGAEGVRQRGPLWIFKHRPGAEVKCTYEVDPGGRELDWGKTHYPVTGRSFFHGMGNAFLLVPHDEQGAIEREFEVVLRWKLPAAWKAACSWGVGRTIGGQIKPADLRNSVYLAGDLETRRVTSGKIEVDVAAQKTCGLDLDAFAKMALNIIEKQVEFMAEPNFPPFVVTAVAVGEKQKAGDTRLAGVGLHNSFALFIPPKAELDDAVDHLFAHELFHYWNGRVLPAADPERLVFWFVEGLTDYYALRILFESGRWDARTYAKWINRHLREYHRNPAINARNEQIQDQFWSQRDTVGEVAYQRGLVLGLRWHKLARDRGVRSGLDALFLALVQDGRNGSLKLTNDAIRRRGVETLGAWFGPEFDQYVVAAATVPVPEDALRPGLSGRTQSLYDFELGFDRERSLKEHRVRGLAADSEAARAGLKEGDELVGWTIPADNERNAQLQVRRGDRVETISYMPRGRKRNVVQFSPTTN